MQKALENVVLHKVDAEKGEGKTLTTDFTIEGFPTFVLVKADGQTIERWRGYGDVKAFTERLAGALQDPTTIEEKRQRFTQSPSMSDAEKLGDYQYKRKTGDSGSSGGVINSILMGLRVYRRVRI